jgi:hypothetical protein
MVPEIGERQATFWDIWIKIGGWLIAIGTLMVSSLSVAKVISS